MIDNQMMQLNKSAYGLYIDPINPLAVKITGEPNHILIGKDHWPVTRANPN